MAETLTEDPRPIWARLLTPERLRFIKFGIVGGSGVVVNLVVVWVVGQTLLGHMASRDAAARIAFFAGIVVSIFTNFLINDRWTWGDREKRPGAVGWLLRLRDFYVAASLAGVLQWLISSLIQHHYGFTVSIMGISADALTMMTASLVGIIVAMPLNYFINHLWTFRERDPK